jgi:hypothetical protein
MCLLHRYVGGGSRAIFVFIMGADFGVAGAPVNLPHFKYSAFAQNTRQRRTSRGTLNELLTSCIFTTWAICNVLLYLVFCDSARQRRTSGPHPCHPENVVGCEHVGARCYDSLIKHAPTTKLRFHVLCFIMESFWT